MVALSIDEPTVAIPELGYWCLQELSSICGSKNVQFEAPGLISIDGKLTILLGRPITNNRGFWKFLRRGHVKVLGIVMWTAPGVIGHNQSNLDLIKLEYSSLNYLSASDLHVIFT
ncbi:hypothetical protein PHMEG_00020662 [Phytophthora megakarya]|uniref:Uncharacterized protein n=1 Tax=Phytophthora megakarya TaxID=4795 RepID=A0A225VN87_9STRA|nr:hypothetical protein PHMEG_00020662 [Phytophthora megakarya]